MAHAIEGLETFDAPTDFVDKGPLSLPEGFDSKLFVGKWVKQGAEVHKAGQSERFPLAGVQAKGWEVWKGPRGAICKRALSSGTFVLMFRPRILQQAVNKLYGNNSRLRMMQEANGETVGAEPIQDRGILTNSTLSQIPGLGREGAEPLQVPLQEIETRPVVARASSRIKPKTKTR